MTKIAPITHSEHVPRFNRKFFDGSDRMTYIGSGSFGGKAEGLAFANNLLSELFRPEDFPQIEVSIPNLVVLRTDIFDAFMERNQLHDIAYSDLSDDQIAQAFLRADLPAEILGDLWALVSQVHIPLAIRSSSRLEDAMFEPFAGIYATKMIPNNQFDVKTRFHKLDEAVKFVYASTFFQEAKGYIKATRHSLESEKMAVIIQEVVGERQGGRFYPIVSGVARSYNFYPVGYAKPQDGVVDLAFGLGKTIVDGGRTWTYSPSYPRIDPPFGSVNEMLKHTQTAFWAINMGDAPQYDPLKETEYLLHLNIDAAEGDDTLRHVASTVDAGSGRLSIGTGANGPRIISFSPLLKVNDVPFNDLIKHLLARFEKASGTPVEIEFALTFNPTRLGFLQVRPMVVSDEEIDISDETLQRDDVLMASDWVLGNGRIDTIEDIVYVRPERFDAKHTVRICGELEAVNRALTEEKRPYLLIGFGRWGSSDPWLGIPVNWGQISGARVIVEAVRENMNVELSQGSHFFHNLTSFKVGYFSIKEVDGGVINWPWLESQYLVAEMPFVKHVRLPAPLQIRIDGRSGRGVIQKPIG